MDVRKRCSATSWILLLLINVGLTQERYPNVNASVLDTDYAPDRLLVRFAPSTENRQFNLTEKEAILGTLGGGTVKTSFNIVPGLTVIKLPENLAVDIAIETYKNSGFILYAEPDYRIYLNSNIPNDTEFDEQWNMDNSSNDADIDAPEAWDIATDSSKTIAIVDTGIDYNHPDLSSNMWVNSVEYNGDPNVDDDCNGKTDDIYGWDFADNDNNPIDSVFHGTHVAGIAGAVGNNNEGVAGACWDVKLMALKVFESETSEGFVSNLVGAIEYAVNKGSKIINMSLDLFTRDNDLQESLEDAISAAGSAGTLIVCSAGNRNNSIESDDWYPSNFNLSNIISVMATTNSDTRWTEGGGKGSCWGQTVVDIASPGDNIFSTTPTYETTDMQTFSISTDYDSIDGTSQAAPHVAGACALIWSVKPSLSNLEVKQIIMGTVDKLASLDGKCVTEGRLNLYNALSCVTDTPVFSIKNASSQEVAWFGNKGNLFLAGTLTENTTPSATGSDEFRIQDSSNNDVAIINLSSGNIEIYGSLYEGQTDLSGAAHFIIKNDGGSTVGYIDSSGNLYLKGHVIEGTTL